MLARAYGAVILLLSRVSSSAARVAVLLCVCDAAVGMNENIVWMVLLLLLLVGRASVNILPQACCVCWDSSCFGWLLSHGSAMCMKDALWCMCACTVSLCVQYRHASLKRRC
jgi:hypothetical protein